MADKLFQTILSLTIAVAGCCLSEAQADNFKILYAFTGGSDGAQPASGLLRDSDGTLWGTAIAGGGSGCGGRGCGIVFRIAPDGTESTVYAFAGGSDGAYPYAAPVKDAQGILYGTTAQGGRN